MAALTTAATPARAQDAPYAFPASLPAATRAELTRLADSVRAAGIPTDPLVLKAAEGVVKGAEPARIVRAVRALVAEYDGVRGMLARDASPALLTAAVNVLRAGVPRSALAEMVSVGSGDGTALAAGLVAAADLVTNGVPASRAAAAVTQLLRRRAPEAALLELRAGVARDVANGGAPDAALGARLTGILGGTRPP
jgi:hypothetical protein